MKKYLIGVDIGTTTIKAVFLDAQACTVVTTQTEEIFPVSSDEPDWLEYDPAQWWEYTKRILKRGFEAGVDPNEVAGICFGGWTVMAFLVDANGEPLTKAVHYNDLRHMDMVEELSQVVGEDCLARNGNYLSMYSGIAKQAWFRKHRPEVMDKARYFSTEVSWLNWKLTGNWGWTRTEAGFFGQYNSHTRQWDPEILEKAGLPIEMFPPLYDATDIVGTVTPQAAEETGLAAGTPVLGGVDDAAPVAITTGVIKDGQCYLSVGSAGNIVANSSGLVSHPTTIVYPHCIPGLNVVCTVLSSFGISYKWMRNAFAQAETAEGEVRGCDPYDLMNQAAEKSPLGAGGVMYLPYLDGDYTPNNDPNARGCFIGVGVNTTKGDLYRAVLEGTSYSVLSNIKLIRDLGGNLDEIVLTGGIAKSRLWLQIIADVTGCSISLPEETEGAPFGSAIVAGVGTGVFSSFDQAVEKMVRIRHNVVTPNRQNHERYQQLFSIYLDLYPQLAGTFARLAIHN